MTLRQLVEMERGRMAPEKVRSRQAAALLAMFANVHRDPRKSRAASADDYDPYAREDDRAGGGMVVTEENWQTFIDSFTGGRKSCDTC